MSALREVIQYQRVVEETAKSLWKRLPVRAELRPSGEYLDWRASQVFRG